MYEFFMMQLFCCSTYIELSKVIMFRVTLLSFFAVFENRTDNSDFDNFLEAIYQYLPSVSPIAFMENSISQLNWRNLSHFHVLGASCTPHISEKMQSKKILVTDTRLGFRQLEQLVVKVYCQRANVTLKILLVLSISKSS